MATRKITLEHRHHARVVETLEATVERAREILLQQRGVNGYHWTIRPPQDDDDEYDDDARYAADCAALGLANDYA